uniref:Uncharacterized protein n=1 Tax=Rhizophora mucronata TaxID=61149 RepID=A0A2P2PXF5_RHIMU
MPFYLPCYFDFIGIILETRSCGVIFGKFLFEFYGNEGNFFLCQAK